MHETTRTLLKKIAEANDNNDFTPERCWAHIGPAVYEWRQAGQPDKEAPPPPRIIAGMEVTPGWEMPTPPREGLQPCFTLHGGDGWSLYWWDESWGKWPNDGTAFTKAREAGFDSYIDDEPLVNPDTGGSNYKATEEAMRELGFRG